MTPPPSATEPEPPGPEPTASGQPSAGRAAADEAWSGAPRSRCLGIGQLMAAMPEDTATVAGLLARFAVHHHRVPSKTGVTAPWPQWVPPAVIDAYAASGVTELWQHQQLALDALYRGDHVALTTGTASGKSLPAQALWLSMLHGVCPPWVTQSRLATRTPTALVITPTKALAADQHRSLELLHPGCSATLDGDTPSSIRQQLIGSAQVIFTNPDFVHASLLPNHIRWRKFLKRLSVIVVDESHSYTGIFGSHVALVVRRLRRVCDHLGQQPRCVLLSATTGAAADHAADLIGSPSVTTITEDTSSRSGADVYCWQPGMASGDHDQYVPSINQEASWLLAKLVTERTPTLAFVNSRRGCEVVAGSALSTVQDAGMRGEVIAAYRGGYLPPERRKLEQALRSGDVLALACTSALELGVDFPTLQAVLLAGWPGSRAALWQRIGRVGRGDAPGTAVFLASDDPLDQYVLNHPEVVFDQTAELAVVNPNNPHVLTMHLLAAAAELPLTTTDDGWFGDYFHDALAHLLTGDQLRQRGDHVHWVGSGRPSAAFSIRGVGRQVDIVNNRSGEIIGTTDGNRADSQVHKGAIYVHQGTSYLITDYSPEHFVAQAQHTTQPVFTVADTDTRVRIIQCDDTTQLTDVAYHRGVVDVISQVTSYTIKRSTTGEIVGHDILDLPERTLRTHAVWWTMPDDWVARHQLTPKVLPGALHAAEHAAIGILPLIATCARADLGGLSTERHVDTGVATFFVHEGTPGGMGLTTCGFQQMTRWMSMVLQVVSDCSCDAGCPRCIQSPKCGNGNDPLDKAGAIRVLQGITNALVAHHQHYPLEHTRESGTVERS